MVNDGCHRYSRCFPVTAFRPQWTTRTLTKIGGEAGNLARPGPLSAAAAPAYFPAHRLFAHPALHPRADRPGAGVVSVGPRPGLVRQLRQTGRAARGGALRVRPARGAPPGLSQSLGRGLSCVRRGMSGEARRRPSGLSGLARTALYVRRPPLPPSQGLPKARRGDVPLRGPAISGRLAWVRYPPGRFGPPRVRRSV
jgi:hypothetical protein